MTNEELQDIMKKLEAQGVDFEAFVATYISAESSAEDTDGESPVSVMLDVSSEAKQKHAGRAASLAEIAVPCLWEKTPVREKVRQYLEYEGMDYVTDTDFADVLDSYLMARSGNTSITVDGEPVAILTPDARGKTVDAFFDWWADSELDKSLRSAAVYRSHQSKLKWDPNATLPDGVLDPDMIEAGIPKIRKEIAEFLQGGRSISRARKIAKEYAAIIIPALRDKDIISSWGIPIKNDDPYRSFIDNKRDPQTRLDAGIKLAVVLHNLLMFLDDEAAAKMTFREFFESWSDYGHQYCRAIDDWQKTSDEPITVPHGEYYAMSQFKVSVSKMTISAGSTVVHGDVNTGGAPFIGGNVTNIGSIAGDFTMGDKLEGNKFVSSGDMYIGNVGSNTTITQGNNNTVVGVGGVSIDRGPSDNFDVRAAYNAMMRLSAIELKELIYFGIGWDEENFPTMKSERAQEVAKRIKSHGAEYQRKFFAYIRKQRPGII